MDVAALRIDIPRRARGNPFPIDTSASSGRPVVGAPAHIIGLPRGLGVAGSWPIWITGHIASEPDFDYDSRPLMLIDARTREGMSGYYTSQQETLSCTTLAQYHTILSSALKAAMLDGLVTRNVASIVVGKPRINRDHADLGKNCWEAHEAHAFIKAAKAAGPRPAAFYALALDSGARKGELCGLQWGVSANGQMRPLKNV